MFGLGMRLAVAMQRRGITKLSALARALNVHESTIVRWKQNGNMTLEHAKHVGEILDISLDWLLADRGEMDSHKNPSGLSEPTSQQSSYRSSVLSERSQELLDAFVQSVVVDCKSG